MRNRRYRGARVVWAGALLFAIGGCGTGTPSASPSVPDSTPTTESQGPSAASVAPSEAPLASVTILQGADVIQWAPTYIARDRYFAEQNIESETIVLAGGLSALIAGDVDFAMTTVGAALNAIEQDQPLVAIAALTNQYGNSVVMRTDVAERLGITYESSEADKIEALRGLTIGIAVAGGGADQLARYLLSSAGMDPDRDAVLVAGESQGAALAAGRLDAMVFPSPGVEVAVAQGDAVWLIKGPAGDISDLNPMDYGVLLTRTDYIQENPGIVQRVVYAVVQGTKLIRDSPDEARDIVRTFFPDLEEEYFNEAWETNLPSFSDPLVTTEGYDANIRFAAAQGLERETPYEEFTDPTFAQAAKEALEMD